MYWSRKFQLSDCRQCNYIGIHKNDKRHAELYICEDGTNTLRRRQSRVLNRKDDVLANQAIGFLNDNLTKNCDKNCIKPTRSLQHLYRSNFQSGGWLLFHTVFCVTCYSQFLYLQCSYQCFSECPNHLGKYLTPILISPTYF